MAPGIHRVLDAIGASRTIADLRRSALGAGFSGERVGLAVEPDRLRAVSVRRGRIVWAIEGDIEPGEPIERALASLMESVPRPRAWPRPAVVAALSPTLVQTRLAEGLPALDDARLLGRVVQESTARFFLRNGVPLITASARAESSGQAWTAAYDPPTIRALDDACRAVGMHLLAVVPSVAILHRAFLDDTVEWNDGQTRAIVSFHSGRMSRVTRMPGRLREPSRSSNGAHAHIVESSRSLPSPATVPALEALGTDAWRFADAYAAAVTPPDEPLGIRTRAGGGQALDERALPSWRLPVAIAVWVLALSAALLAPAFAARNAARQATTRLATLAVQRQSAVRAEQELARVSAALAEIAAFDAGRRSSLTLLREITKALPEDAALAAFRTDSFGGTIVALARRGAAIPAALEGVAGIESLELLGPVTKEAQGAREVERVTVRFRFRGVIPSPGRGRTP